MKKIFVYFLAIIGLFSILKFFYGFFKYQSDASEYFDNCKNVKVGMTLKEAKIIMGDYPNYKKKNRSEIWTYYNNDNEKTYYLTYPALFAASEGTNIYFDPSTQIVTKVVCGEKLRMQ